MSGCAVDGLGYHHGKIKRSMASSAEVVRTQYTPGVKEEGEKRVGFL